MPHCLDGKFDASPGGHNHDGQRRINTVNAPQQVQTFLARGRVARVVQIHEHHVKVIGFEQAHDSCGRVDGFDLITFSL